jgi:hypothetical protein
LENAGGELNQIFLRRVALGLGLQSSAIVCKIVACQPQIR